jgi:aspartate/tyrosine/aromatic aminotransferase
MQTVSGTGGLKLGFMLLKKFFNRQRAYVPNPTWSLHHNIIKSCDFELTYFRWYNPATKRIDMPGLLEDLSNMEDEQILLLQTSCHNPSGCDPTKEEWESILEIVKRKKHFVFFDSAYQGFGNEDYNEDTWSLRHFARNYSRVMLT